MAKKEVIVVKETSASNGERRALNLIINVVNVLIGGGLGYAAYSLFINDFKNDFQPIVEGIFFVIFSLIIILCAIFDQGWVNTYFGYYMTWVGRGLFFFFIANSVWQQRGDGCKVLLVMLVSSSSLPTLSHLTPHSHTSYAHTHAVRFYGGIIGMSWGGINIILSFVMSSIPKPLLGTSRGVNANV
jgi:hypothetical protein